MQMNFAISALPESDEERMSPLESDIAAFKFISKDSYTKKGLEGLNYELEAFQTKWFDYRHMTPLQATLLYISKYGLIYRQVYAANFDRARSQHIQPPSLEGIMKGLERDDAKAKSHFSGMWAGRLRADLIGMPYDLYIRHAFEFRLRYWGRTYMPKPNQLYSPLDVIKIAERWEKEQEGGLYVGNHPAYLVQNYVGAEHQKQHRLWLIKQAMLRGNPAQLMARFINDDLLTIEDVETLRPEFAERVRQLIA
jgi:hypothetical protein